MFNRMIHDSRLPAVSDSLTETASMRAQDLGQVVLDSRLSAVA